VTSTAVSSSDVQPASPAASIVETTADAVRRRENLTAGASSGATEKI
jgi:hypothetical protein